MAFTNLGYAGKSFGDLVLGSISHPIQLNCLLKREIFEMRLRGKVDHNGAPQEGIVIAKPPPPDGWYQYGGMRFHLSKTWIVFFYGGRTSPQQEYRGCLRVLQVGGIISTLRVLPGSESE